MVQVGLQKEHAKTIGHVLLQDPVTLFRESVSSRIRRGTKKQPDQFFHKVESNPHLVQKIEVNKGYQGIYSHEFERVRN